MPSRVRNMQAPKRSEFRLATVLDRVARDVEIACFEFARALEQQARANRNMLELAASQLRERGLDPPVLTQLPAHSVATHDHELLCLGPERAIRRIRLVTIHVSELERDAERRGVSAPGSSVPMRIRNKSRPTEKPLNFAASIQALTSWAYENGIAPVGTHFLSVAYEHLHLEGTPSALCREKPCRKLAVCRALVEFIEASDSPAKIAARGVAKACFLSASALIAIGDRIAGEPELATVARELAEIGSDLRSLDEEIRVLCLTAPRDHAPRAKRSPDRFSLGVFQRLDSANFEPATVAQLIVGRETDGRSHVKNVRRQLARYKARDFRVRYLGTPDA